MTRQALATALALVVAPAGAAWAQGANVKATPVLKATADSGGKPHPMPAGTPEFTVIHVEIPPGAQGGWHTHPVPTLVYVLEGELTIELDGGRTQQVKAGEAIFEMVDVWQNGRNTGQAPLKMLAVLLHEQGKPHTVRAPAGSAGPPGHGAAAHAGPGGAPAPGGQPAPSPR
jgi:quercetin dioxygenase-like cupin family protein